LAGAAFGMAGTQNFGLSTGMISQDSAETGSPEGLGFTGNFRALAAVSFFFFFEPLVAALDDALPLPDILSASSTMSFSLSFGLSILHKSDGI
jgi:hypothetical protein